MTYEQKRYVNLVLHNLASHYMTRYSGDIILSIVDIQDGLECNGNFEVYVSTTHFNTETSWDCCGNREKARMMRLGDWAILFQLVGDDKLSITIEQLTKDEDAFAPVKKLPIDRWEEYKFLEIKYKEN